MAKKDNDTDINELLAKHAKDATQFIVNPETLDQMVKDGLKLDKPEQLTNEEYIDKLFSKKQEKASKIITQLPAPPNIALPPITSLYAEIGECILFGLNGAAITLSAVLVEFALKHAIVDRTTGIDTYDGAEWDRIEDMQLGEVINEARRLRLLRPDDVRLLRNFKNEVRNPYLHYNIKKITSGAILQEVSAYSAESKRIHKKYNLKAEDNPSLWQTAKKSIDKQRVINAFEFADSVVRRLFLK